MVGRRSQRSKGGTRGDRTGASSDAGSSGYVADEWSHVRAHKNHSISIDHSAPIQTLNVPRPPRDAPSLSSRRGSRRSVKPPRGDDVGGKMRAGTRGEPRGNDAGSLRGRRHRGTEPVSPKQWAGDLDGQEGSSRRTSVSTAGSSQPSSSSTTLPSSAPEPLLRLQALLRGGIRPLAQLRLQDVMSRRARDNKKKTGAVPRARVLKENRLQALLTMHPKLALLAGEKRTADDDLSDSTSATAETRSSLYTLATQASNPQVRDIDAAQRRVREAEWREKLAQAFDRVVRDIGKGCEKLSRSLAGEGLSRLEDIMGDVPSSKPGAGKGGGADGAGVGVGVGGGGGGGGKKIKNGHAHGSGGAGGDGDDGEADSDDSDDPMDAAAAQGDPGARKGAPSKGSGRGGGGGGRGSGSRPRSAVYDIDFNRPETLERFAAECEEFREIHRDALAKQVRGRKQSAARCDIVLRNITAVAPRYSGPRARNVADAAAGPAKTSRSLEWSIDAFRAETEREALQGTFLTAGDFADGAELGIEDGGDDDAAGLDGGGGSGRGRSRASSRTSAALEQRTPLRPGTANSAHRPRSAASRAVRPRSAASSSYVFHTALPPENASDPRKKRDHGVALRKAFINARGAFPPRSRTSAASGAPRSPPPRATLSASGGPGGRRGSSVGGSSVDSRGGDPREEARERQLSDVDAVLQAQRARSGDVVAQGRQSPPATHEVPYRAHISSLSSTSSHPNEPVSSMDDDDLQATVTNGVSV